MARIRNQTSSNELERLKPLVDSYGKANLKRLIDLLTSHSLDELVQTLCMLKVLLYDYSQAELNWLGDLLTSHSPAELKETLDTLKELLAPYDQGKVNGLIDGAARTTKKRSPG
jgi:hypothetical protein